MAVESGAKEVVAAIAKVGTELLHEGDIIKQMSDPAVIAETNATIKKAMADPQLRKFSAKFTVDAMQQAGIDLAAADKNLPKHGVPVTREEFDKAYETASSMVGGDMLKHSVAAGAEMAKNKAVQEQATDLAVMAVKTSVPDVANELKDRGLDPSGYVRAASKATLGPADIDISKLDPRLSADERSMVVASHEMATKLTDGRLQSQAEDAPATSKWGNRIKAEKAAAQTKTNGLG